MLNGKLCPVKIIVFFSFFCKYKNVNKKKVKSEKYLASTNII